MANSNKYLKFLECLCVKSITPSGDYVSSSASISAKITCSPAALRSTIIGIGSLEAAPTWARGVKSSLTATASLTAQLSAGLSVRASLSADGDIKESDLTAKYSVKENLENVGSLFPTFLDKFAGNFGDFECVQKLYPSADLDIDLNMGNFVGPLNESGNLYSFIDEGIFIGDYDQQFGNSTLLSDDANSFIHPDTFHTDGTFQYKCQVNNFIVKPELSRFRIRASAPITNYEAALPPEYTIYDIKFNDPSGNLIIHYDDIMFKGDAEQNELPILNFSTYSSAPKVNNATKYHEWQDGYPVMHEKVGYTLTFNVKVEALDDAFDEGFDPGFEENETIYDSYDSGNDYLALDGSPLSTQDNSLINPTKNIRISAVEICNSGHVDFGEGYGPRYENYLSLYVEVPSKGRRIERKIFPSFMPVVDFDTGIWPSVSSIWYPNTHPTSSNEDKCGAEQIVKNLQESSTGSFATIDTIGPHLDSGKLTLKFSHGGGLLNEITKGAFDCGFDQTTCPTWFDPSGAFNSQNRNPLPSDKGGFFDVESVTLKVTAKKQTGTRNYVLDVVGYSDDKLLNVTKAPSGFLQNPSGVQINNIILSSEGVHPYVSGFAFNSDNFALSAESLSEKDYHYEASGNPGGDHYSLTTYPLVTSTEFVEYEVPLKIYDDNVKLGKSRDYSMGSLFENLYLDIYPLPSGASIANIHLLVRYKPQDAFNLSVEGGEDIRKIQDGRSEGKIFPDARGSSRDNILNAGSGYGPISSIENIPHGYGTPSSIKTNYSRRWRGMEGTVQGPYDPDMFGFGFENPLLDFPFLSGFYDFDNVEGLYVKSRPLGSGFGNVSGLFKSAPEIYQNIGWRFSDGTLFSDNLPGYTGAYKTSDWTSLSKGATNFQTDDLYGKIADAFNNVVRISGFNQNINFGNIDTTSGFAIFARFTPDVDVTGAGYNLFTSGVIFSKWDSPNSLDFALGYSGGYLCGYAKDIAGNVITVADTLSYSGYQFPLSVILTYNDHQQSGLKLYTDNEANKSTFAHSFEEDFDNEHIYLRASSEPFYKNTTSADFVIGNCEGSGVGMNMLLAEFGISTWNSGVYGSGTNIVEANPDKTHKQVTAEKFFDNHRAKFYQPDEYYNTDTFKLWDYVNEDTNADWEIGDFKYYQFSMAFSHLTKRTGSDLINFHINHHGSGYIQNADLAMPSSIDSGVAYHTQVENDFLRFHLTDTPSNFYSVHRRITKNLPAGYKFSDRALVVETVIEHTTDNEIIWPECQSTVFENCKEYRHSHDSVLIGPKLIVSLYTKNQEPQWATSEPNWGLINRSIHYLEPSSCLMRLDSKFTYNNLTDESEQWALFPNETRVKDFGERYFSQDVDDMFLQYDLVYPSGPPFESRIDIHTAHVRMDDAYVKSTSDNGNMNIFASGGNILNYNLNVFTSGGGIPWPPWICSVSGCVPSGNGMSLNVSTSLVPWSGVNLYVSGALRIHESLPLFALSSITYETPSGLNFNVSGELRPVIDASGSFNLAMPNIYGIKTATLPLTMFNSDQSFVPSGGLLNLFTYAPEGDASGTTGIRGVIFPLNVKGLGAPESGPASGPLELNVFGFAVPDNRFPSSDMTLFINTPRVIATSIPLYIFNEDVATTIDVTEDGQLIKGLNLFTANYGGVGSDYLMWYNNNYGKPITQYDNIYASVPVGNEIRGVDLIGYGSCTGDSPSKAIDSAIITDDTVWRPETCEDGGIFRAKATYTNLNASGFGDTVGFSGNYYGIRKFTGLTPGAPYQTTLKITTGSTDAIQVPRTLEDWEYGHCGSGHFADSAGESGCCASDCEQSLVYSGVKLIGDYPYLNDDKDITPPSGRNLGDNYGRAVSVVGDLMAVGSPDMAIPVINQSTGKESGIQDAGAVFLYRRGADIAGRKASWTMEDKLMLPSGYRKDYISYTIDNLITYDQWSISGQQWNIGQEGRRFGNAVDLCSSGDRETLAISAPFAQWSREFDQIVTSGIPIGMIVFTDSFTYSKKRVEEVASVARKWDILYKYFSAPWNAGTDYEFQPQLDIKLIIFELSDNPEDEDPVDHDHNWFRHKYINRMDNKTLTDADGEQAVYDGILSGVKGEFHEAFNYYAGPHSGIPPILGVFQEDSHSAGFGAFIHPTEDNDIVSEFLHYYQDYAYISGVIDPTVPEAESGYFNKILGASEDWKKTSIDLLNETLNSGNLIREDALTYITSGVGQEWAQPNAYEFQIPPSSGGRVYIFEKESGIFNCVQEIKSFSDRATNVLGDNTLEDNIFGYGSQHNDRYGHSVSISKNSEIISIGSPYTHTPCEIYERDDSENTKMYGKVRDYLVSLGETVAVQRYDDLLVASGSDVAQRVSYHEMTHDQKFGIRIKYSIQLYKPIFNYKYSEITNTGTWNFILNEFLGTSRLGYSTAINDDGNIVAFGAPTDSTTMFEDSNVWYRAEDTWASYTNAGAVRIFESKKIYPHSGVVEFTRFGNLDRSMHAQERSQGLYDQMGLYFEPSNLPFRRMDFEEIEIPTDVGLAFVITPELDSASDEIIDNIKTWLAKGDRTLVLVGNDPVYEENGLYKNSNDIVNKVLKKLGSRMRIHPADSQSLALPVCVGSDDVFNDRYNITKAFLPKYAHTNYAGYRSNIKKNNMFAKGVGDIRMDLSDVSLQNFIQHSPCDDDNPEICNLPLKHVGDFRPEWNSSCVKTVGNRKITVKYKTNWGFHFGNPNPAQSCDLYPQSPKTYINRPYEDVVPILTTAEFTPDRIEIIPARSGVDCRRDYCWKYITIPKFKKAFVKNQLSHLDFSIKEDSDSEPTGIFTEYDIGTYFDPDVKNDRDCLLQAKGIPYAGTPNERKRTLLPDSILALQESYSKLNEDSSLTKTTSKAIIIASMLGENKQSFGSTNEDRFPSLNKDQNILFFVNMLTENCNSSSKVLQLGGWTGRSSFKDAYSSDSDTQDANILRYKLESYGIQVEEGFDRYSEPLPEQDGDNKVTSIWIANPLGKPDDIEVQRLREFLDRGNKRVIITYAGNDDKKRQEIAENVEYICDKLNLKSRPCYVPSLGEFFVQSTESINTGNEEDLQDRGPDFVPTQIVNPQTLPTAGCENGYGWYKPHQKKRDLGDPVNTKVEKVALWPYVFNIEGYPTDPTDYIPISGGGDFERIVSYDDKIQDTVITIPELYKIETEGTMQFPAVAGSGYRMFFDWVSETRNDYYDIDVSIGPVVFDPNQGPGEGTGDSDQNGFIKLTNTIPRDPESTGIDLVATKDYINVTFSTSYTRIDPEEEKSKNRTLPPLTTRLLSVSGCPLPIEIITENETKKVPCDPPYTETCTTWYVPEQQILIPGEFRSVKHESDPHCNPYAPECPEDGCCDPRGKSEIEDGPIVAAEEFEHFSAGINGNKRSKIVVISDSTMIQGQCPQYRSDSLGENQGFIRSLYPESSDFNDNSFANADERNNTIAGGRLFEFTQKLRAPERGSAAKYYAVSGIPNTVDLLYGLGGVADNLGNYFDKEDYYHPANPGFAREANPVSSEAVAAEIKKFGQTIVPKYGLYPRYSGDFLNQGSYVIDGVERGYLVDAGRGGGLPDLMKLTGNDYLDFDLYASGCPGDLFGFSIDLTQDKLIVGTPFNAFHTEGAISGVSGIVQWHEIQNDESLSGIKLSENGGAGSTFYYERTGRGTNVVSEFLPWEFKQKIKPDNINVGLINPSIVSLYDRGDHNLDADFIQDYARKPDQFGFSVAIDADMIAVGAPNHDFESLHDHSIYNSGAFLRKEFNSQFRIPHHVIHDLGSSGVRFDTFDNNSGTLVLNNGAVFNFRHEMLDWPNRSKSWIYKEKLYPQGHNDRIPANKFIAALVSGCENDHFGWSVSINRAKRGDSDYTLVAGAPFHDFATSGNHPLSSGSTPANGLEGAGSAYTFDAMLRDQIPSIPNSGSWIYVEVFGDQGSSDRVKTRVYQNTAGDSITYEVSGIIFPNEYGDIFLEGSGLDPALKGFIAHRPFVESVIGTRLFGEQVSGHMALNTFGRPNSLDNAWPWLIHGSGSFVGGYPGPFTDDFLNSQRYDRPHGMSMYIRGPSGVYVYNNGTGHQTLNDFGSITLIQESGGSLVPFNIYIAGCSGIGSGTMPLVAYASQRSNTLNLTVGSGEFPNETLNLNTRGR